MTGTIIKAGPPSVRHVEYVTDGEHLLALDFDHRRVADDYEDTT